LNKSSLPDWFDYPKEYLRVVDLKLTNIEPWFLLHGEQLEERFRRMQRRFPGIGLIPFARRSDNDDVVCWAPSGKNMLVYVVHDFSHDGWEKKREFSDFWSWYRQAIEDMIEHDQPYR